MVLYIFTQGTPFIQSLCQKLMEEYILNNQPDEKCRDLESILRGDEGVQTKINGLILNENRRQTMQWEVSLSKYIRFQRRPNKVINSAIGTRNNRPTVPDMSNRYSSISIYCIISFIILLLALVGAVLFGF